MKTGSSPNTHLIVQTECSFLSRQSFMKTHCKRLDLRLKVFKYIPLYWIYRESHDLKSEECLMFCGFSFTISLHNWYSLTLFHMIEFHFLHWEVFFLMYSKSRYKSVTFSFWVSIHQCVIEATNYQTDMLVCIQACTNK